MRRLGRTIYIHEEVSELLERDRKDVAPRFAMLCRQLGVKEWVRYKPTKGENAGWRRSPLGGNNGSHYYMWWVAAGAGPGKQLELGEGDIAIRAVRHHDLTDKRLACGHLDDYWEFRFAEELDDEEIIDQPWTHDQRAYIEERADCQVLIGPPGSGKTSSLWRAVEVALLESRTLSSQEKGMARALYLTWSPRLAERAEHYFQVMAPGEVRVYDLCSLYSRLLGEDMERVGLKANRASFVGLIDSLTTHYTLKRKANKQASRLFDLIRAWVIGRGRWSQKRVGDHKGDNEQEKLIQKELAAAKELVEAVGLDRLRDQEVFPELFAAERVIELYGEGQSTGRVVQDAQGGVHVAHRYQFVVIDEVQDLTPLELESILTLSRSWSEERPNLFIAGDEGQVVRPTFFEFAELNDHLYQSQYHPQTQTLATNLRCPKIIADCVSRTRHFHRLLNTKYRPADQADLPSQYETQAIVGLCLYDQADDAAGLLKELTTHPTVQVIDLFEDSQLCMRRLGIDSAGLRHFNTAEATKGLEFTSVCIIGASHLITQLDRERAQQDPIAFRLDVNRLRVAISRAMEHLVFLERSDLLHDELRTLIGGEATSDEWVTLAKQVERLPMSERGDEALMLTLDEVRELLAPTHLSADERIQGFLDRAGRLLIEERRVTEALHDLSSASRIIGDHPDVGQDLRSAVDNLIARLAMTEALRSPERRELNEQTWGLSLINEAILRRGGHSLQRLMTACLAWSSGCAEIHELELFYDAISGGELVDIDWITRVLSEYRYQLLEALHRLASQARQALHHLDEALVILGFDVDEIDILVHQIRRLAFDRLITNEWRSAELMWQGVDVSEHEDQLRSAKLLEAQEAWHEAAELYEALGEQGSAFSAYRNGGDLTNAGRLLEGREVDELAEWKIDSLALLSVSAQYLTQYPLSLRERAELLRHGSPEISRLRGDLASADQRARERLGELEGRQQKIEEERDLLVRREGELEEVRLELEVRAARLKRREKRLRGEGVFIDQEGHLGLHLTDRPAQLEAPHLATDLSRDVGMSLGEHDVDQISQERDLLEVLDGQTRSTQNEEERANTQDDALEGAVDKDEEASEDDKFEDQGTAETLEAIPILGSSQREQHLIQREVELTRRAQVVSSAELKVRRSRHGLALDKERLAAEIDRLEEARKLLDDRSELLEHEVIKLTQEQLDLDEAKQVLKRREGKLDQQAKSLSASQQLMAEERSQLMLRVKQVESRERTAGTQQDQLNAYEDELSRREARLERIEREQNERAEELRILSERLDERNQKESGIFPILDLDTPEEIEEDWEPHYTTTTIRVLTSFGGQSLEPLQTMAPKPAPLPQSSDDHLPVLSTLDTPPENEPSLTSDQMSASHLEPVPDSLPFIPALPNIGMPASGEAVLFTEHVSSRQDLTNERPHQDDFLHQDEARDTEVDLPAIDELDLPLPSWFDSVSQPRIGPGEIITDTVHELGFTLVYCPPGKMLMGSDQGEPSERPRHDVELTEGFLLGQVPVTQRLWGEIMGHNPSRFLDLERPVERISWSEAVSFCNRLSFACGLEAVYHASPSVNGVSFRANFAASGYRLPTEAEWEYAARAGTELPFAGSRRAREVAWTSWSADQQTHPVGQKKPNEWGLYDLSGNVAEWCADVATSYEYRPRHSVNPFYDALQGHRAIRGGSWACSAHLCRVTSRGSAPPEARGPDIGLRIIRRP